MNDDQPLRPGKIPQLSCLRKWKNWKIEVEENCITVVSFKDARSDRTEAWQVWWNRVLHQHLRCHCRLLEGRRQWKYLRELTGKDGRHQGKKETVVLSLKESHYMNALCEWMICEILNFPEGHKRRRACMLSAIRSLGVRSTTRLRERLWQVGSGGRRRCGRGHRRCYRESRRW